MSTPDTMEEIGARAAVRSCSSEGEDVSVAGRQQRGAPFEESGRIQRDTNDGVCMRG
ncbi:hypothetical protein T484DRAFT_1954170 [Baffinella frigidus]|nr:hypothetical protein T484DRAFT_1954170 [Cryptophyta sp. CCMP2293]